MDPRARTAAVVSAAVLGLVVPALPAHAAVAYGRAWDNFPSAFSPYSGGSAQLRDFPGGVTDGTRLAGPYAHAYLDVADDDSPAPSDEVAPSSFSTWGYALTTFSGPGCAVFVCTWDPVDGGSHTANAKQAATQAYWFVTRFHDHLAAAPISFTPAAGGFEGNDPVLVEVHDGATAGGGDLPDAAHLNSVRVSTPPDGASPRLELGLWSESASTNAGRSSADDASLVYGAYARAMADRRVTDAAGAAALGGAQGQALRAGWGDWYAMDQLVAQGHNPDTADPDDVVVGFYVSGGYGVRSQPMDCLVTSTAAQGCAGTATAGAGGYTYADFGKVGGAQDPDANGEVWAQTLWEVRQVLVAKHGASAGVQRARAYVSQAMDLLAPGPTLLDARAALVRAADPADRADLWTVLARRGLGYYARTTGPADTAPVADFSVPPALAATSGLTATAGPASVALGWSPVAGASGYEVYRRAAGGTYPVTPTATSAAPAFRDLGLQPGTTYCYQVAAAFGPRSAEACATAAAVPAAPPATVSLSLARKVKVKGKAFTVGVQGAPSSAGDVVVRAGKRVVGQASFTTTAAGSATVKVKIAMKAWKRLARGPRTVKVTVVVSIGGADTTGKAKLVLPRGPER